MIMMKELDFAVLKKDVNKARLERGDLGTVLFVHDAGKAYEVEFITGGGNTLAVLTLDAADLRPLGSNEILHAREIGGEE